jgi:site-specific DNA-methyltransferase (adenine-specific)
MTLPINEIIHGDCLDVMPTMPDKSIDMILCDLPYGTTACKWDSIIPFEPLWEQYERVIKDNGAIVLFGVQPFTSDLINSNRKMYKYDLIWNKDLCKNPGLAKIRPLPSFENISVFGNGRITYNPQMEKGKPYTDVRKKPTNVFNGNEHKYGFSGNTVNVVNNGTRYPKSVITLRNPNRKGQHPTQKPVDLMEYLIKTYTNEGETVLDNCMGSGTTAIAAYNTGRNFIGIEKEKRYVDIAKERYANHTAQLRLDMLV